ncbi:S8 family serine peptidase [uncultured Cocleimonas sp.]|uniref:S8 family serine peptidase n=1 Tax=uncultured Cocleimonas sp. TaxID=1051587 RepID=UPI00260A8F8B|nr:S8 family serine peptidase [uncultured Cocleimonas sp.]
MKLRVFIVVSSLLYGLTGCGGGGSSSNSTSEPTTNSPAIESLAKTTIVYSASPSLNEELKISIEDNTDTVITDYSWRVMIEPAASDLKLNASIDGKSVLLTPAVSGTYKLSATSATGETLETQFSIEKYFPFDNSKLEGYDATQELSKQIGIVLNQAWVYSETLSESAIKAIVSNYQGFNIIDFDEVRGLLVEFDETLVQSQTDINTIKAIAGIGSVDSRVFEGKDFSRLAEKTPNDGSAFDDAGDNWHLEHMGMENAWDISTGNSDFYIGIVDGSASFHTQHEDLRGRFKEATKATSDSVEISHGTGVAGAIGAISNNNKGISGINWTNQLIAGKGGYFDLSQLISRDDILLSNVSLSLLPRGIPTRFDPSDADSVEEMNRISLAQTSDFRKLATEFSDKLFVFSAGNGIGNGAGNSKGVFGVDGLHGNPALHYHEKDGDVELAKKDNVLFVAAHVNDNRLPYYSNYGESIDIAAPTAYKSTKNDRNIIESFQDTDEYYTSDEYGGNTSRAFSGTSASAPLVTGVASLILAVDQKLTAANVKSILINSATSSASERYVSPFNEDTSSLTYPIPIVNAANALSMAKEIEQGREVKVTHRFPEPFKPIIEISLSSANGKLKTDSYNYAVSVKPNATSVDYDEYLSGNIADYSPLVFQNFPTGKTYYKVEGEKILFTHQASKVSVESDYSYAFIIPNIMAVTTDKDSQAEIPNISLDIKAEDGSFPIAFGSTDANGNARLYLAPGKYTIIAKADGYNDLTKAVNVEKTDTAIDISLELVSGTNNPNPGPTGENLQPITPLTNSEISILPNLAGIPNVSSLTVTEESGFSGSIDQDLSLIEGVSSIKAVDIQRDVGFSVLCEGETTKPFSLSASDFSTGAISETYYDNGQQIASCSSNYQSILPLTLTNANLFGGVLEDWVSEAFLNSNCFTGNNNTEAPPFPSSNFCTSVIVTNYLITDVNGVEHKISTRLTTVPNY